MSAAADAWLLLDSDQDVIMRAVLDAPGAWSEPAQIAESLMIECGHVIDIMTCLVMSGWLAFWESPESGPLVTLTPLAAHRLGVRLEEGESGDALYWTADAATARPRVSRADAERSEANRALLAESVDPSPDHRDMIEALDYLHALLDQVWPSKARRRRELWERLPNPSVCVGMSDPCYLPAHDFTRKNPRMGSCGAAYPENPQNGRTCKGCKGGALAEYECCPRCSRDGLEALRNRLIRLEAVARSA